MCWAADGKSSADGFESRTVVIVEVIEGFSCGSCSLRVAEKNGLLAEASNETGVDVFDDIGCSLTLGIVFCGLYCVVLSAARHRIQSLVDHADKHD